MKKLGVLTKFTHLFDDKEKILASVGASFLLSLTLLFFGPSYIYFTNLLEIPYYYSDIVWFFIAYSLAAGAIISIILILVKGSIHQRFVAIIFALGLLLWIQGQILVWNYGVLDGRAIVWENYLINGLIDSVIWIAILGFAFFKGVTLYRHVAFASLVLLLLQCGGLMAEVYQAPDEPEWKSYALGCDDETKFEFSSEQNVIILVLDAFRSDVFQEIIEEEPEYRKMFDGFTYYRNSISGFPYTDASPTLILTGEYYNNSILLNDFIKNSFLNNSLPLLLKESGYNVGLYPSMARTVYLNDKTCSNSGSTKCEQKVNSIVHFKEMGELQQLALFRYVPHFFKKNFHFTPFVGSGANKPISRDLEFYNNLKSNFNLSSKKVFKFYHLQGPHGPLNLNDTLQVKNLPFDDFGYKEQAKASLRISYELIKLLKSNGVFDNSMIFIVADHGARNATHGIRDEVNTEVLGYVNSINEETRNVLLGQRIPLFLVKPFNNNNELLINDVPITIGDIPHTVTSELNIPNNFPGQSVFTLNESNDRERIFFEYIGSRSDYERGYLPTLRKYSVLGHSWLTSSWNPTLSTYVPGKGLILPNYEFSVPINFGMNGNAQIYQAFGWSGPENGYTWTDGYQASLGFHIENTTSDLKMIVNASPYLGGVTLDKQHVKILANSQEIGEWIFDKTGVQEKTITIQQNVLLNNETQNVTFVLPDAISPKKLGQSDDTRNLALAVQSITIEKGDHQIPSDKNIIFSPPDIKSVPPPFLG